MDSHSDQLLCCSYVASVCSGFKLNVSAVISGSARPIRARTPPDVSVFNVHSSVYVCEMLQHIISRQLL